MQYWPSGQSPGKHGVTPLRLATTQPALAGANVKPPQLSQRPTIAAASRVHTSRGPQSRSVTHPGRHSLARSSQY